MENTRPPSSKTFVDGAYRIIFSDKKKQTIKAENINLSDTLNNKHSNI